MKKLLFLLLLSFSYMSQQAQVTCAPTGNSGSGYPAFDAAGFGVENPDCIHTDFGPHITQFFDDVLQKNVFLFHSHIDTDNDRCIVFDRVRMEVKGGPNSDEELKHPLGSTSYYRWKFRIDENYVGGSSFHHIFQLKAKEGDDGLPTLTVTLRTNKLEVRHSGGDSGVALGILEEVDLSLFKGKWIEAYFKIVHAENGEVEVILKDLLNGNVLLQYANTDIDLWRTGADYNRPKWGMYRSKNINIQDEAFRFGDFCISETAESLCPADATVFADVVAPTVPNNLTASNIMINSVDLDWEISSDAFGVTAYRVYQDGTQIWEGAENNLAVTNLVGSTSYEFTVAALDAAGNISAQSTATNITTDDATALPDAATNPMPTNGSEVLLTNVNLSWTKGDNADSTKLFFGSSSTPPFLAIVNSDNFSIMLDAGTVYYWQIVHKNSNGETASPVWNFATSSGNPDAPWLVYRGNQRLDIETDFLNALDIPATPTLDNVTADPNGSTNTFYNYRQEDAEKFRWRQELNPTDTAITVVARLKALNEDVNCITYFEIKAFGWREKLRLNQSTVKLERSDPVVESDIPFEFKDAFHLIRVTMKDKVMKVYLDDNPVPIAVGSSIDDDASSRFEFGKAGSPDCGASIDWIAILNNEANAPDEGSTLPSDLFLSSIATLTDLQINGTTIPNFDPNTFDYTIDVGTSTTLPMVTYTTNSDLATTILTDPTSVPNTSATIEVTAQDGFTNNTYTLNYTSSVSTKNELAAVGIEIFPNPAKDIIFVKTALNDLESVELFNVLGESVYYKNAANNLEINTNSFPSGLYIVAIKKQKGEILSQKILIKK